ncbi:MAG TPA: BON domain-containing protein [Thermoanaerobaculia bacterium]|nr:BON domain-containing protein [Thermoanaerobaculia bacterium]
MKRSALVCLAMTILLLAACTSLNQITPAELDDAAVEADVRARIAQDVPSKTFEVGVKVESGVVTLTGHAGSEMQRRQIADAASKVPGVQSVINNIHVMPGE